MSGQFEFRELLLKIQDLLSDSDRERLHFLLGDDVPRNLRDDLSLGGTLRVLQSLFDKSFINEQDCVYLIEALQKIRCFDAAKRLQEYQQNHGEYDTQSLSLVDILWKDNEDDKVTAHRTTDLLYDSNSNEIHNTIFKDKKIIDESYLQSNVTINQQTTQQEQNLKISFINRIFSTSISCREWILITLLLLVFIIAIPLAIRPWKRSDEKITKLPHIRSIVDITHNGRWSQNGVTILGGHGPGDGPNQLRNPGTIDIDNENTIYVADDNNHRIIELKLGQVNYRVIVGGNEPGNGTNQLDHPVCVIVEKTRESLIICDSGNRRLIRWSLQTNMSEEMILIDIDCQGLGMDERGFLYMSNKIKGEIRRFRIGEKNGIIVAGGNHQGPDLNQLDAPNFFAFDHEQSIYVSDVANNRVTKWILGAKEGIVIAGSLDAGLDLKQFNRPFGIIVDRLKTIYVVDSNNCRIMRWREGMNKGEIILGGNGRGNQANQLNNPVDIAFDQQGNIYITDFNNHRIQKYLIEQY